MTVTVSSGIEHSSGMARFQIPSANEVFEAQAAGLMIRIVLVGNCITHTTMTPRDWDQLPLKVTEKAAAGQLKCSPHQP